jgi:hypothetical protein
MPLDFLLFCLKLQLTVDKREKYHVIPDLDCHAKSSKDCWGRFSEQKQTIKDLLLDNFSFITKCYFLFGIRENKSFCGFKNLKKPKSLPVVAA